MDIRKLQRAIVDGLEDVKAQDIVVFNTEHLSPLFERVIVASGSSNRQTKALAASVRDAVREAGFQVLRTEGQDNGEWIIVDCAAAVVHIMQPAIRNYYQLEEIWGEKPVAIKLNGGRGGLVKASEPDEEAPAAAPRKATGKVSAARKTATTTPTATRKTAARKTAPAAAPAEAKPARKTTSTRPAANKAVAAKKAVAVKKAVQAASKAASTAAAKPAAAKKAPARKVAAKKAAAKVARVVVNAPARKPAVKKVAAKKVARPAVKKVAAKKVAAKKAAPRK